MISDSKGFTVVEVIVSLAIIAIVIASSISLYSYSVAGIFTSGEKGEKLFDAQGVMEEAIYTAEERDVDTLQILFQDVSDDIKIQGEILKIDCPYGGRLITLQYFKPKSK